MLPNQTFSTIQQLINYINTVFVTNGANGITGAEGNNILNGITTFLQSYLVNNSLVTIYNTNPGTVYMLQTPMTLFTTVPTSIQWPNNVQNEYYIINATSQNIPIAGGYSYTDQYGTVQTTIPARTAIHIAKATNQSWVQVNNLGESGGGGLPPVTGNGGESLFTDGNSTFWAPGIIPIYEGDSNWESATQWVNGHSYNVTIPSPKFLIFWNEIGRYLLPAEYEFVSGGFNVLVAGFNSATANVFLSFLPSNESL
jgi:hypothetical protein